MTKRRPPFHLHGRRSYQLRSVLNLYRSIAAVTFRRLFRGPRLPNWSWGLETAMHFLKTQTQIAFDMPVMADGREYADALMLGAPAIEEVTIEPSDGPIPGEWFEPKAGAGPTTILYLHGGGYAYSSKTHRT